MFARLAAGRAAAQRAPGARPALDADLLLRPADQRRAGRRRAGGRAAVPDRLRGGPRAAVRRHRRAVRGRAARRSRASSRRATRSASRSPSAPTPTRAAVPLFVVRVGDRLIITMPGEADGRGRPPRRARVLVAAIGGSGDPRGRGQRPRERVHPVHHHARGVRPPALRGRLDDVRAGRVGGDHRLAGRARRALRRGEPAPDPAPVRSAQRGRARRRPVRDRAPRAARCSPSRATSRRGAQAVFHWQGGPRGLDRRLDRRFVAIQRRSGGRWRRVADDLGLAIVWTVDDDGRYDMHWQVPRRAKPGALPRRRHRQHLPACAPPASRSTAPRPRPTPTRPTPRRSSRRSPTADPYMRASPISGFFDARTEADRPRAPRLLGAGDLDVDRGPPSGAALARRKQQG